MEYKIRQGVLNVTMEQWNKVRLLFGDSDIVGTPEFILDNIGLISIKSAIASEHENECIDKLYELYRKADN